MIVVADRTKADIVNQTSKGFYNYTDLNRVGTNVAYIAALLNSYGYTVNVSPKTDWALGDIPTAAQLAQYLASIAVLKAALPITTPLPSTMEGLTYTDTNNIEALLLEAETRITNILTAFLYSGEIYSGEA